MTPSCRGLKHFSHQGLLYLVLQIELEPGDVVKAHVPKHHLTDHAMLADQLLATYSVGDEIEAVCFERDVVPIMTMKPFIVSASNEEAKTMSFDDLHEGQIFPGKSSCIAACSGIALNHIIQFGFSRRVSGEKVRSVCSATRLQVQEKCIDTHAELGRLFCRRPPRTLCQPRDDLC